MPSELLTEVLNQLERLRAISTQMSGCTDYASSLNLIEQKVSEIPALPAFLHQTVERTFPITRGNTIKPDQFLELLRATDSLEKCSAILAAMPKSDLRQIHEFLAELLAQRLPDMRHNGLLALKSLPQHRKGPPKKPIDETFDRTICAEVAKLIADGEEIGVAIRTVSRAKKISARKGREIWQRRKKKQEPPLDDRAS